MCGIAGILDPKTPVDVAALGPMLAVIEHRGPDDEGRIAFEGVALGMRRLSILDPTAAGHQPMSSADGRHWIVLNGEIYNFLELATELEAKGHRFVTRTDTEVVLAAYTEWGPECTTHFNGIWAFAIWDVPQQRLVLSRDRFGVKPLFLTRRGERLAFASEIKALLALPWVSREPEPAAIHDFLRDGLVDHTSLTFFGGIERVPAAHTLVVGRGRVSQTRYWGPPVLAEDASMRPAPSDGGLIDEIRELLIDSVALQLRADVPLGSCLSGGLDSSSIVCIAAAVRRGELHPQWSARRDRDAQAHLAFFAEFREEGIDERPFVDAVVAATGVGLRTTTPQANDVLETLANVLNAQDEPFGSSSIVAQYFVMRLARENAVKVLLDGQGADELFAGYPPDRAMRAAGALRGDAHSARRAMRTVIRGSVPRLPALGHFVLAGRPLPPRLRRHRMPDAWLGDHFRRVGSPALADDRLAGTTLARNLWRQVDAEVLPALLRFEDRNSMAFGIEARVPFLDHRLVEASMALPDRLKIADSELKVSLRRAMRDIVPESVLDRRDKIAFRTPQRRWLQEALPAIEARTVAPQIESMGYVRSGTLHRATAAFASGRVADPLLWRLLNLELWLSSLADPPFRTGDGFAVDARL